MEPSVISVVANPSKCKQFGMTLLVHCAVSRCLTFSHFWEGPVCYGCRHKLAMIWQGIWHRRTERVCLLPSCLLAFILMLMFVSFFHILRIHHKTTRIILSQLVQVRYTYSTCKWMRLCCRTVFKIFNFVSEVLLSFWWSIISADFS